MNSNSNRIRKYLFGELSEQEQADFEQAYFEDDALFDQLIIAEEELIEDYLRDRLTPGTRQKFEHGYLTTPARREKVEMTRSLLALTAGSSALKQKKTDNAEINWQGLRARAKRMRAWFASPPPTFAYAMLLLFALTLAYSLWLHNTGAADPDRLAQLDPQQPATEQSRQALRDSLAQQQRQLDELRQELLAEQSRVGQLEQQVQAQSAGRSSYEPVLLALASPRMTRSEQPETSQEKRIPKEARLVQFHVFPERIEDYSQFRVELQTTDGQTLWIQTRLPVQQTPQGPALSLLIPADLFFQDDYYFLQISGIVDGEAPVVIDSIAFRLIKQ